MQAYAQPRLTPWVVRLTVANAVVLLLLQTVFTSESLQAALAFDPHAALTRPWTFLTYMFVHDGLLHLVMNSLGLVLIGSAVEQRMGGRAFLLYYLYCGIGAAFFALLLASFLPLSPFVGASGAVLGVVVGFAMLWPDAEMLVFPIPVPVRARTLAIGIVAWNALMMLPLFRGDSRVAWEAHLGGALFGYLFFRLQGSAPRAAAARPGASRVPVQIGGAEPDVEAPRAPRPAPTPRPRARAGDPQAAEIDRVLDKISATGIESLTPQERKFLDEVAERKRRELH